MEKDPVPQRSHSIQRHLENRRQQRCFINHQTGSLSKFVVCGLLFCLKFCCCSRIFDLARKKLRLPACSCPCLSTLDGGLGLGVKKLPAHMVKVGPTPSLSHTQSAIIRLTRKSGAWRSMWKEAKPGKEEREVRHCPGAGQEEQCIFWAGQEGL